MPGHVSVVRVESLRGNGADEATMLHDRFHLHLVLLPQPYGFNDRLFTAWHALVSVDDDDTGAYLGCDCGLPRVACIRYTVASKSYDSHPSPQYFTHGKDWHQ